MFEAFEVIDITTQSEPPVVIHGVKSNGPSGNASDATLPPLLLLHGFPQSHHMWHALAPRLATKYTVIAPDLRGYGGSSKPKGIASYVKSAMANDMVRVMEHLGFSSFYVCGHDRGGRVTHKMCVDYPDRIRAAIVLDICPTLAMYERTDFAFAKSHYHWFFFLQPEPLPETMILGNARMVTESFLGARGEPGLSIFGEESVEHYVSAMEDADTVNAMCNEYRASASLDMDESRDDLDKGRSIKCPFMVIWGANGSLGKRFDVVGEWKAVTDDPSKVSGYAASSGHYIPDQVPDDVSQGISEFFK